MFRKALATLASVLTLPALAADIVLTPPAAGGVAVTNSAGNANRFRVGDDGVVSIPGLGVVPVPATGVCIEIATGRLGTCAVPTGTVTSISAGTGMTGGTITTSGTLGLAPTNLLPTTPCAATQITRWSGSAWACDTAGNGTVTSVGATAPLASSGGATPNISFTGGAAGEVLAGSVSGPAWSTSLSLAGNLSLPATTASVGILRRGAEPFLHSFGAENVFLGRFAGNVTMTGGNNIGIGNFSLNANTSGGSNTALGYLALLGNTTGSNNTALGYYGLLANTTGVNNTAIGSTTLIANTTGASNTAVGSAALAASIIANNNTAVGYGAMVAATGGSNTGIGSAVLVALTTGTNNNALGNFALGGVTTGADNIGIGSNAGSNITIASGNIMIGHSGFGGEANTTRVGNSQTRAFIAGVRGVTTATVAIPVLVGVDGQLGTASSSRLVKHDIHDMGAATSDLMKLRPVTFRYDAHGAEGPVQYGLIAEEVEEVYPGLVAHSLDGRTETVMYQHLPPMLLNEVQKQRRELEAARAQIARLTELSERLSRQVERLEARR